jgi:hypothetical protein
MPEKQIAINRLTGDPYGKAGVVADLDNLSKTWSIDEVRERALCLGKDFQPAEDIKVRLEADLANGALVLFTPEDINTAIEYGRIPAELEDNLIDLITNQNDIAVIPSGVVEECQDRQWLKRAGRSLKMW